MSQDFQNIGQLSHEIDTIAGQHKGWTTGPLGDPTPVETLSDQKTDAGDYSFWDQRANRQGLGLHISNMAAHVETPIAAIHVTPTAQAEPDSN